jgi:hypothetical protein
VVTTIDRLNGNVFSPRIHRRVDGGWCSIIESVGCLSFAQMRRRRYIAACFSKILVAVGILLHYVAGTLQRNGGRTFYDVGYDVEFVLLAALEGYNPLQNRLPL